MLRASLAALVLCVVGAVLAPPAPAHSSARRNLSHRLRGPAIVDLPVRFQVLNVNRSKVPCPADGTPVTLVGRIVASASTLSSAHHSAAVTLYLHEFSFGKWFWNFPDPAYDYAKVQARAGHVSVLVDRLGYGQSSHPNGYSTCVGADADEAHQMVQALRAGTYTMQGAKPRRFQRVVLAGHSGGAMAAEIEAYSFGEIDGLIIFAQADQDPTQLGTTEGIQEGLVCASGGQPSYPGGPAGYAYFGQTDAAWQTDYFHDADPRIVAQATPMRHRDPCGDVGSFVTGMIEDHAYDGQIAVPVLLLYGLDDALFSQPAAGEAQRQLYTSSPDVSLVFFPGAGHALTLQRSAPAVRHTVDRWLNTHHFA